MVSVSMDPWIVPMADQIDSFGDSMPLSPLEKNYQEIFVPSMVTS